MKTVDMKLAELDALPYDVIVRRADGRYHLVIAELPLVADGATLAAAHDKLLRRKTALLRGLLEAGAEDSIELPRATNPARPLALFAAKTAIVCALVGLAAAFTAKTVIREAGGLSVSRLVKRNASMLASEAERFASAPPEVKAERLKKVRAVADELRPYADEVRRAWEPRGGKR